MSKVQHSNSGSFFWTSLFIGGGVYLLNKIFSQQKKVAGIFGVVWKKVMSGKEVAEMLLKNNWVLKGQKGSHIILRKNSITCVIPLHKEIKKGTFADIKRRVNLVEK